MKDHIKFVQIALLFVVVCSGLPASAQSCERMYTYVFGGLEGVPAGSYNGSSPGAFTWNYWMKVACAPPGAQNQTCPTCPKAGHPIVPTTGNTYINQIDVRIPGLGGGLTLGRTWNSLWPSPYGTQSIGMFGPNWRSNCEERIFLDGDDHYLRYARSDGGYWAFAFTGWDPTDHSPLYHVVAPGNVVAKMKSGTTWTITSQNGEQRVFDDINGPHNGKLLSIIDRNGNTTQLTYDGANRLTTVTDAAGRHLNFTYGTGNTANFVTAVTSDQAAGISLTYAYDPVALRLTQVTLPESTFVTFEYESHGLISAVKDANGKVLESHTYDDKNRGLTSSRAGGVDAVTVTYPQ